MCQWRLKARVRGGYATFSFFSVRFSILLLTLPHALSSGLLGTKTYHRRDQAEDPLFSWVDDEVLHRPTYRTFIKLLDNYETGTGVAEVVTEEEEQKNWAFINSCMDTEVATCVYTHSEV